jgi:hypothetical protein
VVLAESLIVKLGSSVAKALAKSLVGEGFAAEVLPELVGPFEDWGKDKATRRAAEKELGNLGRRVAEKMRPRLDTRFGLLDEARKKAVVREAVTTLAKVEIDADLVVKFNRKEEQLCDYLLHSRPHAAKGFSPEEAALYGETLREASRHILKVGTQLTGFVGSAFGEVLEGQDKLLGLLEKIVGDTEDASARFEARYRDVVRERFDRMDLFGVVRVDKLQRSQSLTLSYIALQVERFTGRAAKREPPTRGAEAPPPGDGAREATRPGPVDEMLMKSRRLVVRGDAGSGKTTLLHWMAVRSAAQDFSPGLVSWNTAVPFFIRLRERVKEGFPTPEELPGLVAPMIAGSVPSPRWVHDMLDRGLALVLVDGVDELPREKREQMRQSLAEMVAAYPLARYVVSSRPSALNAADFPEWQRWIDKEGFTEVALQPMELPQIDSFIDNWHAAVRPLIDASEVAEFELRPAGLKRLLRLRPPLRRLAKSPLLCAMICALHRERGDILPSDRITLYRDCCEMLLTLREGVRRVGAIMDYPAMSDPQKHALMQGFAYFLMLNGLSDVETERADAHFAQRLELMNIPGATGEKVRRYFVERSSLLREPVQGRIDFTHRTFQEFLAARQAVSERHIGFLIQNAHNDQWHETIILAAGHASRSDGEELLKGLIARGNETLLDRVFKRRKAKELRYKLHLLALACLETAVELSSAVREYVVTQAASLMPPKNSEEAKMVSAAGDLAIDFMQPRPDHSDSEAAACVEALALIGSDKALSALEAYGADNRYKVMGVLGRAWGNFDRREYARRVLSQSKSLFLLNLSGWEGGEYLSAVTQVSLIKPDLGEVERLAELPFLTELIIYDTIEPAADLTPLAKLKNLTRLYLAFGFRQVSDLGPLSQLQNLKHLELVGFKSASDLSPLTRLPKLTNLAFTNTDVVIDMDALSRMTGLRSLALAYCENLEDVSPLAALENLSTLHLYNCRKVTDVSALKGLKNLRSLMLEGTQVRDLSALSGIEDLIIA